MRALIGLLSAVALLSAPLPAVAQDATPPAQTESAAPAPTESAPPAPTWQGLPFTSLADFEAQIPIGMSRRDVTRLLGSPETIMPGQAQDRVYHYLYQSADGSQLRAVIILRDNAVFIRRLYISTANGQTQRAN